MHVASKSYSAKNLSHKRLTGQDAQITSGLKPSVYAARDGTTEVVPFPKPFVKRVTEASEISHEIRYFETLWGECCANVSSLLMDDEFVEEQ
jgi:hypothetical protein